MGQLRQQLHNSAERKSVSPEMLTENDPHTSAVKEAPIGNRDLLLLVERLLGDDAQTARLLDEPLPEGALVVTPCLAGLGCCSAAPSRWCSDSCFLTTG